MKSLYQLLLITTIINLLVGCKKTGIGEDLAAPNVSFAVSPASPKVGDTVTVTVNSDAEYLSVFMGDSGHSFQKSRIKAIIENDWKSFYDTVYKTPLAKDGMQTIWNKFLKDYNSVEEVKKDFEFFGAVSNVELGVYNNFPEALMNTTYPTMNQLKFTITDRRIPSGIIINPGIYLLGGKDNNPGFSIFETRFVADATDKAIRKQANTFLVPAYFDVSTRATDTNKDTTIFGPLWYFRAFQTNDPLSGRPSEGFYNFSDFYNGSGYLQTYMNTKADKLEMTKLKMYMNGRATENTGSFAYDLNNDGVDELYDAELNPATGLPVHEADYSKYSGFQGDVYISYINLGSQEYEPWNLGVSLGSVYSPGGIKKTFSYVYTGAGDFTISVVGTNVGRKQYTDDGYQTSRGNSLDDYPAKRSVANSAIKVIN